MKDLRDSIFDYVISAMKKNKHSFFLSVDQGAFGYELLKKQFPNRCINIGISEQNAVGVAAGMALEGKIVFIYAISSFIYSRAFEQIKLNLCSMNLKVCIISSGPGYCYAPDGPTHYSLEDINILNSIPNMKIYSPFDDKTCKLSVDDFINSEGPAYIRADKGLFVTQKNSGIEITEIINGKNTVIITHGYFINEISKNIKQLIKRNIGLIGLNRLKPIKESNLIKKINKYKKLIFVDDSWPKASYGLQISNILTKNQINKKLIILSSKENFYKKGGKRDEILRDNNLDISSIIKKCN